MVILILSISLSKLVVLLLPVVLLILDGLLCLTVDFDLVEHVSLSCCSQGYGGLGGGGLPILLLGGNDSECLFGLGPST